MGRNAYSRHRLLVPQTSETRRNSVDLEVSSPMEALQELDFGAGWIATNPEPVIRSIERCDWDTARKSSLGFDVRYAEEKNSTHTVQGN